MSKLIVLICALVLSAQTAMGAVVYDNNFTRNGYVNLNGNNIQEIGNQITLAGTERFVTSVDAQFFVDAGDPDPVGLTTAFAAIYDGSPVNATNLIGYSTAAADITPGQNTTFTFAFPFTPVPSTFWLMVGQVANATSSFGPTLSSAPPLTGSLAQQLVLYENGGTVGAPGFNGTPQSFDANPTFQNNFNFRVEANAVPEPASLGLLALGAVAVVRRRS